MLSVKERLMSASPISEQVANWLTSLIDGSVALRGKTIKVDGRGEPRLTELARRALSELACCTISLGNRWILSGYVGSDPWTVEVTHAR